MNNIVQTSAAAAAPSLLFNFQNYLHLSQHLPQQLSLSATEYHGTDTYLVIFPHISIHLHQISKTRILSENSVPAFPIEIL